MQVFVKVIELGGFTAAARELGVPKSTVSRQVARLEDRLGVRLLHRTTRALRATEAGQAYFERCTRILSDVDDAESVVTQSHLRVRGTLRITGPLTFGQLYLGDVVAAFLVEHPEVRVELSLADRRADLIDEGYDLAIRVGQLDDSSLVARRLGPSTMVIVGSPAYLTRRGTPQVPADLRGHDCLNYEYSPPTWRIGDVTVPVSGRLVSNNGDMLRAAAVAGLGLIYSPRFIVSQQLREGSLVRVLQDHIPTTGGIWALYPANRHLSAKVRAFVDFAIARFGEVPPWERCDEP
ncbi:MAG: LysR family transcriptional regulator [Myxococcota bacterium]